MRRSEVSASMATTGDETDAILGIQRERSNALLAADMDQAGQIHANDFQLITPLGARISRDEYLGAVEAGVIKYAVMELDSPVETRTYGDVALIRYRTQIEVEVQGHQYPRASYWFTDAYEKREGRWQIVWSQGTPIAV
jgi:ketosteroid isomerase-like protein